MKSTLVVIGELAEPRVDKVLACAKELDIRIVMCVTNGRDLPVKYYPDAVYFVDASDVDSMADICKKENASGILGLTDPTVIAAARVSEIMGYKGNSEDSVRSILYKASFRELQKKSGVFCPDSFSEKDAAKATDKVKKLRFPIIVKPMLNSSSQGQSIVRTYDETGFLESFKKAAEFSRNGEVCVEEYIENSTLKIIEIEAFLADGQVFFEGARDSYRTYHDILRPVYDVYPADLSEQQLESIHSAVRKVILSSGASFGHFNAEGFFTAEGEFFMVEINPRQPGNCNVDHIELCCGVDMTRLLLTASLGDMSYFNSLLSSTPAHRYILSHTLFSFVSGEIDHLFIDPSLEKRICHRKFFTSDTWPFVNDIKHAHYPIAKLAYQFETREEMDEVIQNLDDLIYPVIKE